MIHFALKSRQLELKKLNMSDIDNQNYRWLLLVPCQLYTKKAAAKLAAPCARICIDKKMHLSIKNASHSNELSFLKGHCQNTSLTFPIDASSLASFDFCFV